eukprot:471170-Rhodomonas_salina.2
MCSCDEEWCLCCGEHNYHCSCSPGSYHATPGGAPCDKHKHRHGDKLPGEVPRPPAPYKSPSPEDWQVELLARSDDPAWLIEKNKLRLPVQHVNQDWLVEGIAEAAGRESARDETVKVQAANSTHSLPAEASSTTSGQQKRGEELKKRGERDELKKS